MSTKTKSHFAAVYLRKRGLRVYKSGRYRNKVVGKIKTKEGFLEWNEIMTCRRVITLAHELKSK